MLGDGPQPTRCPGCFQPREADAGDGPCPGCGFGAVASAPVADEVMAPPEAGVMPEPGSAAPLPDAPTGGFQTQPRQPAPPPEAEHLPVILCWLLVGVIIAAYVHLGGQIEGTIGRSAFERGGDLTAELLKQPEQHVWRLVFGSFVHSIFFTLLVSGFLVFFLGAEVERRGGGGLLLTVFLGVGAIQNALRCGLEPATSLQALAGAWPAGFALGGTALALAVRRGESKTRVVALFVFEAALLAFLAYSAGLLHWRLGAVIGVGVALGAGLGAVWPLGHLRGGCGCLSILGLVFLTLVASALREDQLQRRMNPPPWEQRPKRVLAIELARTAIEPLGVSLALPQGWKEHPQPRVGTCKKCDAKVPFPKKSIEALAAAETPDSKTCPQCGAEGVRPPKLAHVLYAERAMFGHPRSIQLMTWPKGQYDAPDTLLGDRQLGSKNVLNRAIPLSEGNFPREGKTAMGLGYRIALRGAGRRAGRPTLMHLYMFVGKRRSLFLRCMGPAPDDPLDVEAEADLYDRIAASVAETK